MYRLYQKTFLMDTMENYTLHRPPANDLCSFYAMHKMQKFNDDDLSAVEKLMGSIFPFYLHLSIQ